MTGVQTCALPISAIGAIGRTYSQNTRTLPDYYRLLDAGELPIVRGITLSADDVLRRDIIQQLMCQFALSKDAIGERHAIAFDRYFADELRELAELQQCGLLQLDERWITVTPKGRMLIRSICMVFDRFLREAHAEPVRYSRTI